MSDEIDLRMYMAAIRRRWWVVLLVVGLALGISFIVSARQPKRYQAEATLLAQSPRYQWRFDSRILPYVDTRRDYQRELAPIGLSSHIAQRAAELLQQSGIVPNATPEELRAAVSVRTGEGSTLIVTATADEPQKAAAIANAWATGFVEQAQEVLLAGSDLEGFEAELEMAGQRLAETEEALAQVSTSTGLFISEGGTLETTDPFSARQSQIALLNQRLAQYRIDLDSLRYLASWLEQASPTTDLGALPWELLNGPVLSQRAVLTPEEVGTLLDRPDALLAAIQEEEAALAQMVEQLAAQSEDVQARLAADWLAFNLARREYGVAREIYDLLRRKVEEVEMEGRVDPGLLLPVSEALPPSSPVQTHQLAQLAVAGVVGLIVGVLLALWLELRSQRLGLSQEQVQEELTQAPAAK